MTARTSSFIALALVLAGCAASAEKDGATSAAADSTADHAKHVEDVATKLYGGRVDATFGPFARGESALYRGTFSADASSYPNEADDVIAKQAALATLGVVDGALTLRVEAPGAKRFVDYVQAGAGWNVSMVLFDGESGGMLGACSGCIPALSAHPATIAFTNAEADGHFFDAASSPFKSVTSASLTRAPVTGITYADLETTQAAFGFTASADGNLVSHVEDIDDEPLPTKPGMYSCWLRTTYALDEWVDPTDITKFGVRDFEVEDVSTCCASPGICAGGGLCVPPKQSKSFTTGVGASVTATTNTAIVSADGQVQRSLTVAYQDHGAYFKGATSLHAVAIVHRQGMNGDAPVTLKWTLDAGSDAGVSGTVDLPDAAIITSVELAFSDDAGARWDSNDSQNYRFSF